MRKLIPLLVLAALVAVPAGGEAGSGLLRGYRLRRLNDATSLQFLPIRFDPAAEPCNPLLPALPEVLGPTFDPDNFDLPSVGGDGRMVAYTSRFVNPVDDTTTASIFIWRQDHGIETASEDGSGALPSVGLDRFGPRMAFRGGPLPSDEVDIDTVTNIYLRSTSGRGDEAATATLNVTNLSSGFATHPALAARVEHVDVGGGIKTWERDARVAFVSDSDELDRGRLNDTLDQQVFVWYERDDRFVQITRNRDGGVMARPAITAGGNMVAFESTSDLTPAAANPADPADVGNPSGVRQIFVWRPGKGVRQITWSDRDCFAPQVAPNGNHVLFCSAGDLVPGGNPEGNYEIFRWRGRARRASRVRQLTQTLEGDSVFPRLTVRPNRFVFYSTATPPKRNPFDADGGVPKFGSGTKQCSPHALSYSRGRIKHIHGLLDIEILALLINDPDAFIPATGPPAVRKDLRKIHFATNDPALNGSSASSSQVTYHMAQATRYAARFDPDPSAE